MRATNRALTPIPAAQRAAVAPRRRRLVRPGRWTTRPHRVIRSAATPTRTAPLARRRAAAKPGRGPSPVTTPANASRAAGGRTGRMALRDRTARAWAAADAAHTAVIDAAISDGSAGA